jgi:hypothetical protein
MRLVDYVQVNNCPPAQKLIDVLYNGGAREAVSWLFWRLVASMDIWQIPLILAPHSQISKLESI